MEPSNSSSASSEPEAGDVRPGRSHAPSQSGMVYLGTCLIAGIRLARERQVNVRVVPTTVGQEYGGGVRLPIAVRYPSRR
jgi:hypothetical protein